MNLDELALKIAEEVYGAPVAPMAQESFIAYTHALVAELAKQEPVAWHIEGCEGQCLACLIEREVQALFGNQGLAFLRRKVQGAAPVIPAGWVMVPEHPEGQWSNPDLINIMVDAFNESEGGKYDGMLAAYKAMIAERPKP